MNFNDYVRIEYVIYRRELIKHTTVSPKCVKYMKAHVFVYHRLRQNIFSRINGNILRLLSQNRYYIRLSKRVVTDDLTVLQTKPNFNLKVTFIRISF